MGISLMISGVSAKTINLGYLNADFNGPENQDFTLQNKGAKKYYNDVSKYSISQGMSKSKGIESKRNVFRTKEGNKKFTFKTAYFLPLTWDKYKNLKGGRAEYWYNTQSFAMTKDHVYVLTTSNFKENVGYITKYDLKVLSKYKIQVKPKVLRSLGAKLKSGKELTKIEKAIKASTKVGPLFNVGHGQSLSYNPEDKSLYMLQDDGEPKFKLMRISSKTLKPDKMYVFKVKFRNRQLNGGARNLAFDKEGNFYTISRKVILSGKIKENDKIEIQTLRVLSHHMGKNNQGLAINQVKNRLYVIYDGCFFTIPVDKLRNYNLKASDLTYTVFKTKREFQGMSFDSKGRAYLLTVRGPEIFRSSTIF